MDERTINLHLSRILSGYCFFSFNGEKYKLLYPDMNLKYTADVLAEEEYDRNKYNEWYTRESILPVLVEYGIWKYSEDEQSEKLEKEIDDIKIDLYKSFYNPVKVKALRNILRHHNQTIVDIHVRKHTFDNITLEGYVEIQKNNFLLKHSVLDQNDKLLFDDDRNLNKFDAISYEISRLKITDKQFREIARSNNWSNYWGANQNNLFNVPTINWTDEQKNLVNLTNMYDNIKQHPDCPPKDIIEDDDALDGWMISQNKEYERQKAENKLEKTLPGNLSKSGEVFLMANSREEAAHIYSLNDSQAKGIINERNRAIKSSKHGVQDQHLPDNQRIAVVESNEKFKQLQRKS